MTDKWKPIETAPKDGTPVLVYTPEEIIGDSCVLPETIHVCFWSGIGWTEAEGEMYSMFAPTHWMPLPEPPKEAPE